MRVVVEAPVEAPAAASEAAAAAAAASLREAAAAAAAAAAATTVVVAVVIVNVDPTRFIEIAYLFIIQRKNYLYSNPLWHSL
jgi:hypothetical protein